MTAEQTLLLRQGRRYRTGPDDHYYHANRRISAYLDAVKPRLAGRKLADIGAGEIPFQEYYAGLDVTYCDVQQNQSGTIGVMLPRQGAFPMRDAEYGGIFLFDVLEHVKDDLLFIRECYRILAPGGLVIATVPFLYRFHEQPHDFRRYTPSGLEFLFKEVAGFAKLELKPYGNPASIGKIALVESDIPRPRGLRHRLLHKALRTLLDYATGPSGLFGDQVSEATASGYFVVAEKT
jgi:SAM-dependent methyltransferase